MFENPRRGRQARNFFENSRSKIVFRTDILPKIVVGCSCLVITTYVGTLFILFLPGFLLWFPEGFFHTYFVEALIFFFFRLLLSSCLNWKIYCDDHSSLSSTNAVHAKMNYFIYTSHYFIYTSHHFLIVRQ